MKNLVVTRRIIFLCLFCGVFSEEKEKILDGGTLKTCARPLSPANAVISYLVAPRLFHGDSSSNGGYGVNEYSEHDSIYFHCKEGFSQTTESVMYTMCGSNGQWFPRIKDLGECVKTTNFNKCNVNGLFRCKRSQKCISAKKRCDCTPDCDDESDETDCLVRRKYISAPSTGRDSSGVISSPGYPSKYPSNFSCIYYISTVKSNHIEIDFQEFDLPEKTNRKCTDFVRIVGLHPKSVTREKKKNKKFLSERKCGKDKFKRVFSRYMYLTINVTMGHASKQHRGFALTWKIINTAYINMFKAKQVTDTSPTDENKKKSSNRTYTILTPIAVSALIPLLLIMIVCCHRRYKKRSKQSECKKPRDCTDEASDKSPPHSQQPLMLTENNLALFDNQQNLTRIDHHHVGYSQSDEYSRRNNVNSTVPCDCTCCVKNRQLGSTKKLVDKMNRGSFESNESEVPRYVMSYEVSIPHSPSKHTKMKENSPCVTPEPMNLTTRMKRPYSGSQNLSHASRCPGRQLKTSRDNLRHSHDNIPRDSPRHSARHSYSSQSSSCKLCSQNKLLKHDSNFNMKQSGHHIDSDQRVEQVSGLTELQHTENIDEYPHQVSEYPDENEYPPNTSELAYKVDSFYNSRANYTSFYDFSSNQNILSPNLFDSMDVYNDFPKIYTNQIEVKTKTGFLSPLWTYR